MGEKMKCPKCKSSASIVQLDTKLFGGQIILKNEDYYKCDKCGEEFATSKQVKESEKKLREKFFFKRNIITTGRSLAVTIPPDLAKFYHLQKGEKVSIVPQDATSARIVFE